MIRSVTKLLMASTALVAVGPVAALAQNQAPVTPPAPSSANASAPPSTGVSSPSGGTPTSAAANNSTLGEIVVTSRRVRENLKDVPISVSAVTAAAIENLDIKDTVGLANFTPGLQYSNFAAGNFNARLALRPVIFRGLTLTNDYGVTAGSLIFLDGAPLLGGDPPAGLDIERVEVLRGPQSVYFGRSTMSGAVNYVSRELDNNVHGEFEANVGDYDTREIEGALSGPVTDRLRLGIQASSMQNGGYYSDQASPGYMLGAQRTDSVSAEFDWRPIDNLRIRGFTTFFRDRDGVAPTAQLGAQNDHCNLGGTASVYCGQVPSYRTVGLYDIVSETAPEANFLAANPRVNHNFLPGLGLIRNANTSNLRIDYTFPGLFTLTSQSSYEDDASQGSNNGMYEAPAVGDAYYNDMFGYAFVAHNYNQEVRLTSVHYDWLPGLRWTLGGNYLSGSLGREANLAYQTYTQVGASTVNPETFFSSYFGDSKARTSGVFAGLYYDIIPQLTVSIEGRYQWDGVIGVPNTPGSNGVVDEHTFKSFSPRFALDYKVTPDVSAYVSFANGSRPGGFNVSILPYEPGGSLYATHPQTLSGQPSSYFNEVGPVSPNYAQESLETYEVGVKGYYFHHRLRLNADGYYGDVSNLQIAVAAVPYGVANSLTTTSNAGLVKIWGSELEGAFIINHIAQISATFDWAHTDIVKYICDSCLRYTGSSNVNGSSLPDAPEISGSVVLDLRDHVPQFAGPRFDNWYWTTSIIDTYRGRQHIDVWPGAGDVEQRNVVDLRIGLEDQHLRFEGYVQNLTDNRDYTTIGLLFDQAHGTTVYTAYQGAVPPPRVFGVRGHYKF